MSLPRSLAATAGLCVLLTGCVDPAYMEARRQEMDRQDHATCVGYGTVPGTPAYDDCRRDQAANRARNYPDGYGYSYYDGYYEPYHWNGPYYPNSNPPPKRYYR